MTLNVTKATKINSFHTRIEPEAFQRRENLALVFTIIIILIITIAITRSSPSSWAALRRRFNLSPPFG